MREHKIVTKGRKITVPSVYEPGDVLEVTYKLIARKGIVDIKDLDLHEEIYNE